MKKNQNKYSVSSLFTRKYIYYYYAFFWLVLILYLAIISLFSSFDRRASTDQAVSIVVLIGGINLPIIKLSVEWWNTLHQSASITLSGSSIDNEMLIRLLISIFGFYLYVMAIGMRKMQVEILKRELKDIIEGISFRVESDEQTGYREKVSGGHSPRHRGPPRNPDPDYCENHEETTQSGV